MDDHTGYGPTALGAIFLLASVAGVGFAVGCVSFTVLAVRGIGALAKAVKA